MITLTIPDHIEQMLLPNLHNWEKLRNLIQSTSNDILQIAYTTIESKLHYANMQMNILNQLYESSSSHAANLVKRSMFEGVIVNLVSSLESTAHVINQIYEFGIDYKRVTIDHRFFYDERKHRQATENCVRCNIKKVNSSLDSFLCDFLKRGSPVEEWYEALIEYRHQIVHRPHFVALLQAGSRGYFLPDDPKIIGTKVKFDKERGEPVYSNFHLMREMRQFAEESTFRIIFIVENIFHVILEDEKIKQRMVGLLNF